ncbi:MAG: YeeE/YedE thiosulfate transporter family protein [Gemmatimonadetes bacterium]|nr:YeeE/YedE thiosulfate transporter family protein [Gemmatimonadota bacterium]
MTAEPKGPISFRAALVIYLVLGVLFGIALTMSEALSWYRIQEMFRFQAFHMYGIIGSAIATAAAGLVVLRRFGIRSLEGDAIKVPPKVLGAGTRYWAGGTVFGLGWGLVGACPGPLVALIGFGHTIILVPFLAAIAGTWTYGKLRPHLPH